MYLSGLVSQIFYVNNSAAGHNLNVAAITMHIFERKRQMNKLLLSQYFHCDVDSLHVVEMKWGFKLWSVIQVLPLPLRLLPPEDSLAQV